LISLLYMLDFSLNVSASTVLFFVWRIYIDGSALC
jgi:hypothetical protein